MEKLLQVNISNMKCGLVNFCTKHCLINAFICIYVHVYVRATQNDTRVTITKYAPDNSKENKDGYNYNSYVFFYLLFYTL